MDVSAARPQGRRADRGVYPPDPARRRAPSFHVPGANLGGHAGGPGRARLRGVRAVHLGGMDVTFGLGDPAFFALLDSLRAAGVIVTMDLLSEMPDLLGMARAFLPARGLCPPERLPGAPHGGRPHPRLRSSAGEGDSPCVPSVAEVSAAALALLAEGPRGVLVTMGGEGSLVVTEAGIEQVPALKVEVSDTTGCGDAYCAGFITGLLHGQDVVGAARWGTAAAAQVATGLGSDAGLTDLESILALLA